MSIDHQEPRPGQAPTDVEHAYNASARENNGTIPEQRGQAPTTNRRAENNEQTRDTTVPFWKKATAVGVSTLALLGASYGASKGGTKAVAGTPVATEASPNPGSENAPAPTETSTPEQGGETPISAEQARINIENSFIYVEPWVTSLGSEGIPSYKEMEAAIEGSKLNLDEETVQAIIDRNMGSFNAASVRKSTGFASEEADEFGKNTVDLSLNTGAEPEEAWRGWRSYSLDAAMANPEIPKNQDGQLPFGVIQFHFDYNGGEITASSPHPNTDIFEVPGELTAKYYAMLPGDKRDTDNDGIVEFELGGKLPDGSTAPFVVSQGKLGYGMFKPETKLGGTGGAIYADPGTLEFEPGN